MPGTVPCWCSVHDAEQFLWRLARESPEVTVHMGLVVVPRPAGQAGERIHSGRCHGQGLVEPDDAGERLSGQSDVFPQQPLYAALAEADGQGQFL